MRVAEVPACHSLSDCQTFEHAIEGIFDPSEDDSTSKSAEAQPFLPVFETLLGAQVARL